MSDQALDIEIEVALETPDIEIEVSGDEADITMEIDTSGSNQPPYEGEYSAVSGLHDAVRLETKGKAMRGDVVVMPIPFFEASNPQGGVTITIGN